MNTYPIYRKFREGDIWIKILSDNEFLSVYLGDSEIPDMKTAIVHSSCPVRYKAMDDDKTEECSKNDFEKAYTQALWNLTKTTTIQ